MRSFCWSMIFLAASCFAQDLQDPLTRGVEEFKAGHYPEAAADFRKASETNPGDIQARLYLATALEMQFIPGVETESNLQFANDAKAEFLRVIDRQPDNTLAIASIASLYYNQKKFTEAAEWNKKVIAVDPNNKEAYYTLGVLAWTTWLPVDRQARSDSNQRPDDVGPIGDVKIRESLKAQWLPVLDQGISDLGRALQIDPKYDDAMAYMNLLIRYRADLDDSTAQWRADTARADVWMQKSLDAKRGLAGVTMPAESRSASAPTPQGGVVSGTAGGIIGGSTTTASSQPNVIRQGSNVQAANLISKVDPVYPPLARQARVSGTVRFNITVGFSGTVENLALVSGHPSLVQAAREAIQQYVYKPTLLNGQPVRVRSTVDVNFELTP